MCTDNEQKKLLVEYQAAIEGFNHFDSFRWQSGGLLVAGSLVLWGIVFQNNIPDQKTIGLISIFITILLAIWLLFAHHYRQLYMSKAYRFQEIEKLLGMELNRNLGFIGLEEKKISIYGPKGHNLDILVFIIVSLFGPSLILFKSGFCFWVLIPLPIIVIVVFWVLKSEKDMILQYYRLKGKNPTNTKKLGRSPLQNNIVYVMVSIIVTFLIVTSVPLFFLINPIDYIILCGSNGLIVIFTLALVTITWIGFWKLKKRIENKL